MQQGDGMLSAATTIASQGVTVFPDLAPLSQTSTWISSPRTYVG
jgi:hypothetical protein